MARVKVLTVSGLDSLEKKLKRLPAAVAKKVLRQSLRAALKPVRDAVKANAPVDSGDLKRAVKVRAGKRSRNSVSVLVRVGAGDFKGDTFYAAFQEFGWHSRGILFPGSGKKGRGTGAWHEGSHFMERAFDSTAGAARDRAVDLITRGVEAAAAAGPH